MKHHSKKKQTIFPLKSSEILILMHMFLNRASRLPLLTFDVMIMLTFPQLNFIIVIMCSLVFIWSIT